MTTPTNPVLHIPAHKQTSPAAKPGQISPHNGCVKQVKLTKDDKHTLKMLGLNRNGHVL